MKKQQNGCQKIVLLDCLLREQLNISTIYKIKIINYDCLNGEIENFTINNIEILKEDFYFQITSSYTLIEFYDICDNLLYSISSQIPFLFLKEKYYKS